MTPVGGKVEIIEELQNIHHERRCNILFISHRIISERTIFIIYT